MNLTSSKRSLAFREATLLMKILRKLLKLIAYVPTIPVKRARFFNTK